MTVRPLPDPDNAQVADWLRQGAALLEAQGANPFRVGAYRRAADTVERYAGSLRELLVTQGRDGLDALPGVGAGIAAAIAEMLTAGRWTQLERLRGSLDPAALFRIVPGIGPGLAVRIHDALGVESLEALEVAAHEGRLAEVPGVGPRRAAAIRAALREILDRSRWRRGAGTRDAAVPQPESRAVRPGAGAPDGGATLPPAATEPPVEELLDVDREYREKARAGALPTIAPRRFNPGHEAWLPVLHARRGERHFTALFSNTARAHDLGHTRDWVVLYFHDDAHPEQQRTVVTEQHGLLAGRRVVRGREAECRRWYERASSANGLHPTTPPAR